MKGMKIAATVMITMFEGTALFVFWVKGIPVSWWVLTIFIFILSVLLIWLQKENNENTNTRKVN